MRDSSPAMRAITYGTTEDESGENLNLLCADLITTLERLELLSEVCSLNLYCDLHLGYEKRKSKYS